MLQDCTCTQQTGCKSITEYHVLPLQKKQLTCIANISVFKMVINQTFCLLSICVLIVCVFFCFFLFCY